MRWWPGWTDAITWRAGLLQGGTSAVYFGTNAFLATQLHAVGHPGLVGPCLAALNTAQLAASFIVAYAARRALGLTTCWPSAQLVPSPAWLASSSPRAVGDRGVGGGRHQLCGGVHRGLGIAGAPRWPQ